MPFSRPTLQQIAARVKTDIQGALRGTAAFFRRSAERAIAGALAGASHQLHGHMAWIARQLDPRTADEDILESVHGEPYGVYRKDAVAAQLMAEAPGTNGVLVPAGTVWSRSDGARYMTDAAVTVASGIAVLSLTAETAGDAANCADGTELDIESPIVGLEGTAMVAATVKDGSDRETPDDYLVRVLERRQTPPRGGAPGDYVDWVLEVPGVTRAWEFPQHEGAGTVTVYAVNDADDPITLSAAKIAEIEDYLDEPGRQPSTVDVYVFTPTLQEVQTEIVLTVESGADVGTVQAAVQAELAALYDRIGTPGGMTIPLSQIHEAISLAVGEESHILIVPSADVAVPFGSLPVVDSTPVWS